MYRRAVKKRLTRGRSVRGMVVATIYLACRQCKLLRTIEELSQVVNIDKLEVARYYRLLVKSLGYFVSPQKAGKYITKFCSELGLSGETEEVAYKILQAARELRLTYGRAAKGIAAASCYVASKVFRDYRTQREVSEVARVTEVTIRTKVQGVDKKGLDCRQPIVLLNGLRAQIYRVVMYAFDCYFPFIVRYPLLLNHSA